MTNRDETCTPDETTIAIFGASGRTGKHLVDLALQQGYKVQAFVRTPSKITVQHDNLVIIKGDFENEVAIQQTVKGATHIVCVAGGPNSNTTYPKLMMLHFIKRLWPVLLDESSVETFLYMASTFVPKPDGSNALSLKMLRPVVGWYLGILPGVQDNEEVVKYIVSHENESFKSIVIRPGHCSEDTTKSGHKLVATQQAPIGMGTVAYVDLAAFILKAMRDLSLEGQYPFVVVER